MTEHNLFDEEWLSDVIEAVQRVGRRLAAGDYTKAEVPLAKAGDRYWLIEMYVNPEQIRPYIAAIGYRVGDAPMEHGVTVGEQDNIELSFLVADLMKCMSIGAAFTEPVEVAEVEPVPKDDSLKAPVRDKPKESWQAAPREQWQQESEKKD